MFGIDGPELLVIIIVLIVVVGPKDLPKMMRAFGKATARMRSTAHEFRRQFDDAMREAEMDDLAETIKDVQKLDPRRNLTEIFDPLRSASNDLQASLRNSATADAIDNGVSSDEDGDHDQAAKRGATFDATDPSKLEDFSPPEKTVKKQVGGKRNTSPVKTASAVKKRASKSQHSSLDTTDASNSKKTKKRTVVAAKGDAKAVVDNSEVASASDRQLVKGKKQKAGAVSGAKTLNKRKSSAREGA